MNTLQRYNKLLRFMYDEFNRGNNSSGHGEFVHVLIDHFERISQDNRIGDAHAKVGAVSYFLKYGFIDAVDISGKKVNNSLTAYATGRMQPTPAGEDYLRQRRMGMVNELAAILGTFFGKITKALFGG